MILMFIITVLLCSLDSFAEPVTLQLMWWSTEGSQEHDLNLEILELFEELNPDVRVEVIFADWNSYADKVWMLMATGEAPDLLWIKKEDLFDFAMGGMLEDLGPFIEKDSEFDASNYLPAVLETCQILGRQYGLLRDVYAHSIFYNVDRFEESGIAAPQVGWTYQDLLGISKKLTDLDAKRFGMGNLEFNKDSIIASYGGRWMNEDQTEFLLHEIETIDAIYYMHDFIWLHHAQPQPGELNDWWEPQWQAGEVAMQWTGPWTWAGYTRDVRFRWDVTPPPAGPAGTYTSLGGMPIGISSYTEHPQEAWELLKFLTYEEPAQTLQVLFGIASPVVTYPETLAAFHRSQSRPKSIDHYLLSLMSGQLVKPCLPDKVERIIAEAFTDIFNSRKAPEQTLAEAERVAMFEFNKIIQESQNKDVGNTEQ